MVGSEFSRDIWGRKLNNDPLFALLWACWISQAIGSVPSVGISALTYVLKE
jgi:hypothetical protein